MAIPNDAEIGKKERDAIREEAIGEVAAGFGMDVEYVRGVAEHGRRRLALGYKHGENWHGV